MHWRDPGVRGSRWIHDVAFRDSSDGHGWRVAAQRPFYSLDTRWSFGIRRCSRTSPSSPSIASASASPVTAARRTSASCSYGWSDGLSNGWSRRITFGLRREHAMFDDCARRTGAGRAARGPAPRLPVPALRGRAGRLRDDPQPRPDLAHRGPAVSALRYALEVGWSTPALGADRDALLAHAEASRGWRIGDDDSMFADAQADDARRGRFARRRPAVRQACATTARPGRAACSSRASAAGTATNSTRTTSSRSAATPACAAIRSAIQAGSGTALLTVEQRFFTKYSLWQLADVGAAVFFDMGRALGDSALGPERGLRAAQGRRLRPPPRQHALGARQRPAPRRRLPARRAAQQSTRCSSWCRRSAVSEGASGG